MNIVQKLITRKIAKNEFHASNMLNVLECYKLTTDAEAIARCELYHAWKMSGENKAEARRKTIAGEEVTQIKLPTFEGEQADRLMDDNINGEFNGY